MPPVCESSANAPVVNSRTPSPGGGEGWDEGDPLKKNLSPLPLSQGERGAEAASNRAPIVVYKIGGSLLMLPDLGRRIDLVLGQRPGSRPLIVVGGGAAANLVRRWDDMHHLGQERSHQLALRAMMLNEALLLELIPRTVLVHHRDEAETAWRSQLVPVLCALSFLHREESLLSPTEQRLPHVWDVTSDSIAAWIAARWPAEELVLVKSAPLPKACTPVAAGNNGLVDLYFPQLVRHLPKTAWSNLRAVTPTIQAWLPENGD